MTENILYTTVCELETLIAKWKMRYDVQNGYGLSWRPNKKVAPKEENTPNSIADGLSTTGFCVSASECLLNDKIFQIYVNHNGAKAKLISVDIREEFWGFCLDGRGNTTGGSQNKWHTAIYLEINGYALVIDVTCAQFGNNFIKKDVWYFKEWQETFRSGLCKHAITDFQDNPQLVVPLIHKDHNVSNSYKSLDEVMIKYNLKNVSNITDSERDLLVDFLFKRLPIINNNILLKNINSRDYDYLKSVNDILENLPLTTLKKGYSVLSFSSKQGAKNWLALLLENSTLPCYIQVSDSVQDSCFLNNININQLNQDTLNDNEVTYIILEFGDLLGIETDFVKLTEILLPFGSNVNIKKKNISNETTISGYPQKLNTITVKI